MRRLIAIATAAAASLVTLTASGLELGRDIPPPELDSDQEVVQYVLRYDGAIGYVSGNADLGGAKAVGLR